MATGNISYQFNKSTCPELLRSRLLEWAEFNAGLTAKIDISKDDIKLSFLNGSTIVSSYDITGASDYYVGDGTKLDFSINANIFLDCYSDMIKQWSFQNNPLDYRRIYITKASDGSKNIKLENLVVDYHQNKTYFLLNCDKIRLDSAGGELLSPTALSDGITRYTVDSNDPSTIKGHIYYLLFNFKQQYYLKSDTGNELLLSDYTDIVNLVKIPADTFLSLGDKWVEVR